MHPLDEHRFVVRPVEDDDLALGRNLLMNTPQEVMARFHGAGLFERNNPAAHWIERGKEITDGAVLPEASIPWRTTKTAWVEAT